MKNQNQTVIDHLTYALTFLDLAMQMDSKQGIFSFRFRKYMAMQKLRRQHLAEVSRLIEYAKGILEAPYGKTS